MTDFFELPSKNPNVREKDRLTFGLRSDNDIDEAKTVKVSTALMPSQLFDPTRNPDWSVHKESKVVATANNAGGGHMLRSVLLPSF